MPFPHNFIESIATNQGFAHEGFIQAHEQSSPVSVRLNLLKPSQTLSLQKPVPWCEDAHYLPKRPVFTLDPAFHAGAYYVQEASSMFLAHVLNVCLDFSEPLRVLDLCAAPGGKSTLINSLLPDESLLVANEVVKNRANLLADNLSKWGRVNTFVSNNDPRDFQRLAGYFDVLVIDAPCSGSGLFRKDPEAMKEWSVEAVNLCSQRQKRILTDVWEALASDGLLVYSTCSYAAEENEDMADWICENLGTESVQIPLLEAFGEITETQSPRHQAFGYRFYPDKVEGEGFFITVFQKREGYTFKYPRIKEVFNKRLKEEKAVLNQYIEGIDEYTWVQRNEDYFLLNKDQRLDYEVLSKNLYLRKAGVRLGRMTTKDLIPEHELALFVGLNAAITCLNLDKENALRYLRREDIDTQLLTNQIGWLLVRYEGLALGWAKALPNRLNNYFPNEQRILMR